MQWHGTGQKGDFNPQGRMWIHENVSRGRKYYGAKVMPDVASTFLWIRILFNNILSTA